MAIAIVGCTSTSTQTTGYSAAPDNANIRYFPGGDASSALASIEKSAPASVRLDQEFDYTINVQNLSEHSLANVQLKEHLSSNFKLISSSPQHTLSADGQSAVWTIKKLEGNASQIIRIRGKATDLDTFKNCASLTYQRYLCHQFNVSMPKLTLEKYAPATALVGEVIPVRLVVSNTGNGVAENVIVVDSLPEGMALTNGETSVRYNAGNLASQQSKEMSFGMVASRTGKFNNVATATADDLSAKANAITVVTQPQLKIVKTATAKQYSGRNIIYTIKVTNIGDADAANAVIADPLPAGTSFVKASNGGALSGNQIVWSLGTLSPKASKTVTATVKAVNAGTIRNTACAQASRTAKVCDSAETTVLGVSAILLEVIDSVDPIEVNGNGKYVISATNQGTAPDTNVKVTLKLEDNLSYVSSAGPTAATVVGNKVSFAPLASLAPKARANWTVIVKAKTIGDVRCHVQMDSDNLSRPVMETEATTIY